jgi:hypothetical protein
MIRCHQVDAKTAGSSREHENEDVGVWTSEVADLTISVLKLCVSINSTELVATHAAVVF